MLTIISILQLAIFVAYVVFIYYRYGLLTSISASTYKLQGNERWYFLAFLWSIGLLNFFQGMEVWGFWASAGLFFSGITIDHESTGAHTDIVHAVGTIAAIAFTFIGLWVLYGMWIPAVLVAASAAALYRTKHFIWWIEIIAMGLAIGSYLLR